MTTVWFSLRRRLLGLLLGGVAVAWLVTMVFSYVDAHHEVDELFDAQLAQAAQTLLALASHDEGDDIEDLGDAGHKYQRRLRFQIWRADGKLVMRSKNA
ncbi:MAG: sensor histidine kinase N-terminal domain-containing protein, partial [Azonexus sp.]